MMKQILNVLFFFIFASVITVEADDSYYPCKSYISFSYDDSNSLSSGDFKTQMNFIKNVIGTLNYANRLRAEGGYTGEFNWYSGLSIRQMQNNIDDAEQTSLPYSLSQQASSLLTSIKTLYGNNDPIAALIFISDTSDATLANADRLFAQLNGIDITFILLGKNVHASKLANFSSNFIYWPDLSQAQPDNWNNSSNAAFGCNNITTTSTKAAVSSTTTTPTPYYPCNSWISFGIDDSVTLNATDYNTQLSFISSIIGALNYHERLQVSTMSDGVRVPWNNYYGIETIEKIVLNISQSGSYSLRAQFSNLASQLITLNTLNRPVATVIFISDTSDYALDGADKYMNLLADVRITFVILGANVDASKLSQFSNNFIYWTDLSKPQPDNWDSSFYNAYGCNSVPSTSTMLPATTAHPWTGPSTVAPYIPCQSWISFGVDDSWTLKFDDFFTHLSFISNTIGTFNHPERLQAGGANEIQVGWHNSYSIATIQKEILDISQFGQYNLRKQFNNLVFSLTYFETPPSNVATIIFISDTSDFALLGADELMDKLKNVRITFVLLGPNADSTKLTKFSSNFIYWPDLSKPQPDNWDSLSYAAYGCH